MQWSDILQIGEKMKAIVIAGRLGTSIQLLIHFSPIPMMEHTMMTLKDLGITELR